MGGLLIFNVGDDMMHDYYRFEECLPTKVLSSVFYELLF